MPTPDALPTDTAPRPRLGRYASSLDAELTAVLYPDLDLTIDRDEVGWYWLRETAAGKEV